MVEVRKEINELGYAAREDDCRYPIN